jgi:beta-phosphoglucomutase
MNTTDIQTIIFDMDGVIVDSVPIHEEAERLTFRAFDIDVPTDAWRDFKGKTAHDIMRIAVARYGSPHHDVQTLVAYRTDLVVEMLTGRVQLIPGAAAFIQKARQAYRKLAITTSSKRRILNAILDTHDLERYFDVIVTGDDITRGKPDPEPYVATLHQLGADARQTLVIEDADNGVIAAKRAGCHVAGLMSQLDAPTLLAAGADIVCASYEDLASVLRLR